MQLQRKSNETNVKGVKTKPERKMDNVGSHREQRKLNGNRNASFTFVCTCERTRSKKKVHHRVPGKTKDITKYVFYISFCFSRKQPPLRKRIYTTHTAQSNGEIHSLKKTKANRLNGKAKKYSALNHSFNLKV